MFKADFHIHTKEDVFDSIIEYSAKDIIDIASKKGFSVISITNHSKVYFSDSLSKYAKKKGILLIPGAEMIVEGKEFLVIGKEDIGGIKKLKDLIDFRKEGGVVIAPHPFYPSKRCVGNDIFNMKEYVDALEYSSFYSGIITNMFNRKVLSAGNKLGLPIIGNSDCHKLYQFDNTYSLINSCNSVSNVLEQIREGRIKLKSKPMFKIDMLKHLYYM